MAWRILSSISFLNRLQVSFDWRSKCSTIRKTTTPSKEKRKERIIYVNGEVLFGYHSVRLAVEAEQRLFHAVYYSDTSPRVQDIVALAESKGIPVKPVSRNFLTQMTEQTAKIGGAHKGICADVAPIQQKSADSIIHHQEEVNRQLWLLLCSVGDPYNLGAIIRSAYFLGVDRVFTCSPWDCAQSSAPLTPVASRASAGSVEIFTPMVVRHPELFLDTLADRGKKMTDIIVAVTL
jgi:21S rRNA (GM2251-2'-O)-methyltransferase